MQAKSFGGYEAAAKIPPHAWLFLAFATGMVASALWDARPEVSGLR